MRQFFGGVVVFGKNSYGSKVDNDAIVNDIAEISCKTAIEPCFCFE